MLSLLADANGTGRSAAPGAADATVVHHPVAADERWLFDERREEIRKDAGVNEHDWLTAPMLLILQLGAIDSYPRHPLGVGANQPALEPIDRAATTSVESTSTVMVHPEVPRNSNGAGVGPRRPIDLRIGSFS